MRKIKVTGFSAGYIGSEAIGKIHLVNPLGDGETTMCSYAYVDEEYHDSKEKVNCKDCLEDLKELKKLIKEFDKDYAKTQLNEKESK